MLRPYLLGLLRRLELPVVAQGLVDGASPSPARVRGGDDLAELQAGVDLKVPLEALHLADEGPR